MQNRITSLNAEELHHINGGGENDGEGFAIAATGLAVVGTAMGPAAPVFYAAAATTLMLGFVAEAFEA